MTNPERRALLDRHRQSEFPGSIVDVLAAARQGRDLIAEFESQKGMQVANTPGERQQGLRPSHQAGDTEASMAFPNTPPNQEFNTMGMKAPIDIKQFNDRGNLVKSYEAVPPGVSNLKMSSQGGTVIETPTKMQAGGAPLDYRIAQELAKRKGNTPEFYLASADTIGYHESGPDQRMAINALQEPVPTGRGTFQIEGKDGSNTLETSQKHLRRTMGYWGETPPQNIMDSRDAAELTYEEQRALMLAHLLQGPMPMADYASGKAKLADVWATGWKKKFKSPEDRQLGINKFNASRLHAKKEGIPEPNYIKRKLGRKKRK